MLTLGPFKCLEVTLRSCSPHVLSAILLLPRKAILIEPPHDVKLTRLRSCRENFVHLVWWRVPGAWRILLPEPLYDVEVTVASSLVEGVDPIITNKSNCHLQIETS